MDELSGPTTNDDVFGDWESGLDRYKFEWELDRDFYKRVYGTGSQTYKRRLQAIGFEGFDRVLDAGAGYGQWSLVLGALNRSVTAVEVVPARATVISRRADDVGASNVSSIAGSLVHLPVEDESHDAVFCYGAIFFVDWKLALAEFRRVLRPGGRLYVCANDLGWFLWYLISNHNAGADHHPRRIAVESLVNTARFRTAGKPPPRGQQLYMPVRAVRKELARLGFRDVKLEGEGHIGYSTPYRDAFFRNAWMGLPAVYEFICERG